MDCPACGFGMRARKVDQVDFHDCESCGGIWVATLRSLQLWASFHTAREPLPAIPPEGTPTRASGCPSCARPLESFAYMEVRDVSLQRCNACSMLFVPGDLQEEARALWAKRVGREAVRLERKADVVAAYRPQKRYIGHTAHGVHARARFSVGSDVIANDEYLRNERARDRRGDDE